MDAVDCCVTLETGWLNLKVNGDDKLSGPVHAFPSDGIVINGNGIATVDNLFPANGFASRDLIEPVRVPAGHVISGTVDYPTTARTANLNFQVWIRCRIEVQ